MIRRSFLASLLAFAPVAWLLAVCKPKIKQPLKTGTDSETFDFTDMQFIGVSYSIDDAGDAIRVVPQTWSICRS